MVSQRVAVETLAASTWTRNFPTTGWKQRAKGTADWGGPKASSEPETRALMKAVSKLRPKQAVVFHQDLGVINCPPYRSKSLAKRLHSLTGYPYKCLPVLAGSFTAWANQQYSSTSALTFDLEANPPAERLDGVAAALVTLASTSPGPPPGAGTPTAPTAGADTGAVVRGQSVTIDVLANDRGANGDLVAPGLAVITAPQNGRAEVQDADGPGPTRPQVTYTPSLDAPATDSFTYRLTEAGQTADASVTLSVANAAPTAGDDSAKVRSSAGAVIQVPVLGNDADPDGGTLVIDEVGAPEHGTASLTGGTITYDPTDGYVGPGWLHLPHLRRAGRDRAGTGDDEGPGAPDDPHARARRGGDGSGPRCPDRRARQRLGRHRPLAGGEGEHRQGRGHHEGREHGDGRGPRRPWARSRSRGTGEQSPSSRAAHSPGRPPSPTRCATSAAPPPKPG